MAGRGLFQWRETSQTQAHILSKVSLEEVKKKAEKKQFLFKSTCFKKKSLKSKESDPWGLTECPAVLLCQFCTEKSEGQKMKIL